MSEVSDPVNVAFVANGVTPYRLHVYRRILAEMPEVRLHTIYTHLERGSAWQQQMPAEMNPLDLSNGQAAQTRSHPRNALTEWRKGGAVIRHLRENAVRAVVVWGYDDVGRLRVIRWCHRNGVAVFLAADSNARGDRSRGLRRAIKRAWVGWVVNRCAGVLPCGSLGRQYFEAYGADPRRIQYFPYEPDYRRLRHPDPTLVEAMRGRLGLAPDRRRIVYSGRLVPEKRVEVLLEAFARMAGARPQWDVLILGDGAERAALQAAVAPELADRVKWAGFVGNPDELAATYHGCDVLALPSDYEPWALVINEAVACGLAVVCTDVVGAAAELVHDGVNGRIVPPGDAAALSRALLAVTDPHVLESMKRSAGTVLAEWQRRGDPIDGLRKAWRDEGVIEPRHRRSPVRRLSEAVPVCASAIPPAASLPTSAGATRHPEALASRADPAGRRDDRTTPPAAVGP